MKVKTIIQTLFFAIIAIALIIWRYQDMSLEDKNAMFLAFNSFRWSWALPIFIVGAYSHYIRAKRWELQFQALSIPYTTTQTFSAVILGYLTNIFVPRLGEVTKCTYIAKQSNVPADKVIGTVIAERLWDTICFGVLTLLTLVIQLPILLPYAEKIGQNMLQKFRVDDGNYSWIILLIVAMATVLVGAIFLFKKIKTTKIGQFVSGIKNGLQSIYLIKKKGLFILHTVLLWASYTLVAILVMKAIPSTENLPLVAGLSIITFGTFAMIVPAPGSIAYPIIVAPVLTLYGTSLGVGQGYGWINWANQNLTIIILSILVLLLFPLFKYKTHANKNGSTSK